MSAAATMRAPMWNLVRTQALRIALAVHALVCWEAIVGTSRMSSGKTELLEEFRVFSACAFMYSNSASSAFPAFWRNWSRTAILP